MTAPKRTLCCALALALAASFMVRPARAQGVDPREPAVSAEEVREAIRRGVAYLYSLQQDNGLFAEDTIPDPAAKRDFGGGRTALAVLALLYAGEDPEDPRISKSLKLLAEISPQTTYTRSIRCSVWAKLDDRRWRPLLKADAQWLIEAMTTPGGQVPGEFSYTRPKPGVHDHSNTQYGVLGLRDAARQGLEIPAEYWKAIEQSMLTSQAPNGGWGYYRKAAENAEHTYGAMTTGCLANLYITQEMLQLYVEGAYNGRSTRNCGKLQAPEAIADALAWMDRNLPVDFGLKTGGDRQTWPTTGGHGMNRYYLYAIERCASACGRKSFGGVNWFEQGALRLLKKQAGDGGWKASYFGNDVHTSWAILFLSKGQAPVFYNKLDTGSPDWNTHMRSIPNLSSYIADELEQRVNWQVIDIDTEVETWLDAPVLMFSGHELPQFSDEQKQKLRLYTDSGGTIVAEACCSKREFTRDFRKLAEELWPEWELQLLDRKHPVYEFHHEIRGRKPTVMHLNDGCRSRVFLVVNDISGAWNHNMQSTYPTYFQFGMNLARYASDKRMLRSRLYYVPDLFKEMAAEGKTPPSASGAAATVTIADWPLEGKRLTDIRAMRHLAEVLDRAANVTMETRTIEGHDLGDLEGVDVLHMSGHYAFAVSAPNLAKVKAFIERGGVVWADPQCGREAARKSFDEFFAKLAPDQKLKAIGPDHALMTGQGLPREGFDLGTIRYKQAVRLQERRAVLQQLTLGGHRAVIYSPFDLTCGLDGHSCPNCLGPERNDALKIATNIVLSTLADE